MITIALTHRLINGGNARRARLRTFPTVRLTALLLNWCCITKLVQSARKCILYFLSILLRQLVLERKHPMRPRCKRFRITEQLELAHELMECRLGGIWRQR